MQFQLTTYGVSLLNANTGPITLTSYKLGSAYNYIPAPSDTDIHGSLILSGAPSIPVAVNANIIKYSIYLDYNVGPFAFGEVGLYDSTNTLFALGTATELINKIQAGLTLGNSIRIDIYLSMVGQNYQMWFDLAESNNEFRVAIITSPDLLPQSAEATPNVYVIEGVDSTQSSMLAYTDRQSLWNFDAYQFNAAAQATVVSFDSHSVTIALSQFNSAMSPAYFGEVILEFTTGALYSICRYVQTAIASGTTVTLGFQTPLAVTPIVGDQFKVFQRNSNSTSNVQLPIATATVLGGVKIGQGLDVTPQGLISINPHASGLVTSVNGQTGDVVLNIPSVLPYDFTFSCFDVMSASEVLGGTIMSRSVTVPSGLVGSKAWCDTPPTTSSAQFNILKNSTSVGTVVFSPGSSIGVFTMNTNQVLNPGDNLKVVADATNFDGTLANVMVTLVSNYALPAPIPADYWTSIAYGNGLFVAVTLDPGASHLVGISPDGANWTSYNLPLTETWTSVTYGAGVFVAIAGNSNTAATSPDGVTWTPRLLPTVDNWSAVEFGNGVFVAVAGTGGNYAATTSVAVSADGITWQLKAMPVSQPWSAVAYGAGLFVAVANNSATAATSPDGQIWTSRNLTIGDSWQDITFGTGTFVVISGGHNSASRLTLTSPDGITWSQHFLPSITYWQTIAYGNGVFVAIAGGSHLSNVVAISSNGVAWTQYSMPANTYWQSVAFGTGTFVAIAGGAVQSNVGATSPDGISWIERTI